jgi:hypothetical protein
MKSLRRCILGALITMSAGGGLLLGTQAAGAAGAAKAAAVSSTPAPTVTSSDGQELTVGYDHNQVDIDGTNFVDVTAVDFGGVPAVISSCINDDECFVTAPTRTTAGTVFITVTAAGGTSATYAGNGDEATYYNPTAITATPALLSVSPFSLGLFTLTATVTGYLGAPVSGVTVYFETEINPGGRDDPPIYDLWCQTTTNSAGVATCSALSDALTIIEENGYTVYTPGSSTQFPAQATAPLLSL